MRFLCSDSMEQKNCKNFLLILWQFDFINWNFSAFYFTINKKIFYALRYDENWWQIKKWKSKCFHPEYKKLKQKLANIEWGRNQWSKCVAVMLFAIFFHSSASHNMWQVDAFLCHGANIKIDKFNGMAIVVTTWSGNWNFSTLKWHFPINVLTSLLEYFQ